MSPSLHKLLWHGCEVAQKFQSIGIPIAYTAVEAGETMHSFWKKCLAGRARQTSREARMKDTMRRGLWITSPSLYFVYLERRIKKHPKHAPLPDAALEFLLYPVEEEEPFEATPTDDDDSDEEDNELI